MLRFKACLRKGIDSLASVKNTNLNQRTNVKKQLVVRKCQLSTFAKVLYRAPASIIVDDCNSLLSPVHAHCPTLKAKFLLAL